MSTVTGSVEGAVAKLTVNVAEPVSCDGQRCLRSTTRAGPVVVGNRDPPSALARHSVVAAVSRGRGKRRPTYDAVDGVRVVIVRCVHHHDLGPVSQSVGVKLRVDRRSDRQAMRTVEYRHGHDHIRQGLRRQAQPSNDSVAVEPSVTVTEPGRDGDARFGFRRQRVKCCRLVGGRSRLLPTGAHSLAGPGRATMVVGLARSRWGR